MFLSRGTAVTAAVAVCTFASSPSLADDFWITVARGLQFAGWRPPNGDIGIGRNVLGDGWSVNTTRYLNNIDVNAGVFGWTIDGLQLGSTTDRGEAYLNTELEVRRWLIPSATVKINIQNSTSPTATQVPVIYDLWVKTGVQDVEIKGIGTIKANASINALGFYDVEAFISNRGSFEFNGVLYDDRGTTDYDLGPISLSGNIFADVLAAVTEPLFAGTGTANPFAVLSGRTKLKNQLKERDEMLARLQAGHTLTDDEMNEIITTSILESIYGGAGSDLLAIMADSLESASQSGGMGDLSMTIGLVPEPVSVGSWLLLTGAFLAGRRSRR